MKAKKDDKQSVWNAPKAKELARLSGLKSSHIATEIGIEDSTLSKILNGQTPSLPVAKLFVQVVGGELSDVWKEKKKGQAAS